MVDGAEGRTCGDTAQRYTDAHTPKTPEKLIK